MKFIALLAMLAVSLVLFSGSLPEGSVGSSMTFALMFFIAAIVLGLYEAWSMRRGPIGWIVNVVVAFIGGLTGASLGAMVMELILMNVNLGGSLVQFGGPLLYAMVNGQMLITLLGAWLALQIANRFR